MKCRTVLGIIAVLTTAATAPHAAASKGDNVLQETGTTPSEISELMGDSARPPSSSETNSLPESESLPEIKELPDPFLKADGKRVKTPAEWSAQREYLKHLVMKNKYGELPAAADVDVSGREEEAVESPAGTEMVLKRVTLRIALKGANPPAVLEVPVMLYLPSREARRWPVIVTNERMVRLDPGEGKAQLPTELLRRNLAVAVFMLSKVAEDRPQKNNGIYALYPGLDCGVLAAWAWGYHRTIDYLLTREDIDPKRIAVQGFSRYGMASLVAGMLDERIALTISGGSNVGGVQPVRQHNGTGPLETLPKRDSDENPAYRGYDRLIRVPERWEYWYWLAPRYRQFFGKEQYLPIDSHTAMLLCAPRGLLLSEGMSDPYGYCPAVEQSVLATREVYGFLGASNKLAVVTHGGGHGIDWVAIGDGAAYMLGVGEKKVDYQALKWPGLDPIFSWSAPKAGGERSKKAKQP